MRGQFIPAVIANVSLAMIAIRARALTVRGAIVMGAMGCWIYLVLGWWGFLVPIVFLALGSLFTHIGYDSKERRGSAERHGGTRGVREVLANGLVPLILTLPILFIDGRLYTLGFVGAWATALCDTTATELGSLWGRRCILVKSLRLVPPGTPGAVSLEGCASGFAAALILALASTALGLVPLVMVIPIALAASIASLLESLLAGIIPATFPNRHEIMNIGNTAAGAVLTMIAAAFLANMR